MGKFNFGKLGKNVGFAAAGNMGKIYERNLISSGLMGSSDAGTTRRIIDYGYGAATFGVAPVSAAIINDARQRRAKKQRKKAKRKNKVQIQ